MTRGWCPSVFAPMPSGDGLLARVKPPGGLLQAAALRAVAHAALRHGNGAVDLTSRGNLQVRGLTEASAPAFAAAMVAAALADPDPVREGRRNVIAVPPADPVLALAIEAMMADTQGLAPKFCIATGPAEADIVVHAGQIHAAGQAYPFALATLRRLAEAAAGQRLPPTKLPLAPASPGLLLALPFGQTDAAALLRLADLASAARTTPWRALLVPTPADPAPFARAGFVIDPQDPRRSIAACPGAPACSSGQAPARADAARLAAAGLRGLHVSGCAKGCAHPRPATTLVARAGRYDLVRHGRAADPPAATGLTLADAIALLGGPAATAAGQAA